MRLMISKSKNAKCFYVIKSYTDSNGTRTSKIVEKLGNEKEILKKSKGQDPIEWANNYIAKLNQEEKDVNADVLIKKSPTKLIEKNSPNCFNAGYLFLQKIYHELELNKLCKTISEKYKFEYDLNSILSRLIYGRIIYPSSKLSTSKYSEKFIEQPNFKWYEVYPALEVISKEADFIQSELYKNSLKISKRNTSILYYDLTNYFFEIEEEDGIKKYGKSKQHQPSPLVQMGLFMDGDGIPLAFCINPGNTNEQITLRPLEQKILDDFKLSKFIVCTDAGLASDANRKFNDKDDRAFITTQSIKKLKDFLKEWSLYPDGWKISEPKNKTEKDKIYNINELEKTEESRELYKDRIFYKERWIKETGLEQRLIVTYSIKYKDYHRKIRESQIERAKKLIEKNPAKLGKSNQNDFKRFIAKTNCTDDGEVAENIIYSIDSDVIAYEEIFDGFYGVCTNLEDDIEGIVKINRRRWEIEESFRIMKSEFKARPVYLKRDDRIAAHFTTCFLALVIYRFLEKRLEEKFTSHEIIETLRDMDLLYEPGDGYTPAYTRNDLTDALHEKFNFRTDYEIVKIPIMKKIFKETKS